MSGERDEPSLISKRLRFSQRADLFDLLRPSLGKRVFHVTLLSNLELILAATEIRPSRDQKFQTTFGYRNSFFRKRGYVSVFDYRFATEEQIQEAWGKCPPVQPASKGSGIAFFFISESGCESLVSWTLWEKEKAWGDMIVPHVESGHKGPIPLNLVNEIWIIEVDDDPDPIVEILRSSRR